MSTSRGSPSNPSWVRTAVPVPLGAPTFASRPDRKFGWARSAAARTSVRRSSVSGLYEPPASTISSGSPTRHAPYRLTGRALTRLWLPQGVHDRTEVDAADSPIGVNQAGGAYVGTWDSQATARSGAVSGLPMPQLRLARCPRQVAGAPLGASARH